MTIAEAFSGTATISTTEYSLTNNSTVIATQATKGHYALLVDTSAMLAGDEYEIALREKIISGGTQRRMVIDRVLGARPDFEFTPSFPLFWGWDYTITKIAGTDRSFSWSIRAVT